MLADGIEVRLWPAAGGNRFGSGAGTPLDLAIASGAVSPLASTPAAIVKCRINDLESQVYQGAVTDAVGGKRRSLSFDEIRIRSAELV